MMGVLNHLFTLLLLSLLPPALSHVVVKFSDVPQCQKFFLEGTTPNLPGILVGGIVQNQNRYKPICQLYKNISRFATLYDTTNKIPVFSAYTFTGNISGRPSQSWMIEPQLNCHTPVNTDYKNNPSLDRGHLFPCSHAPDNDTKKSTFTLTNAVPQNHNFNQVSWRIMEGKVREALVNNCNDNNNRIKAYVVTGAVPSKNNTLNNRVNIPDLLWTAFCCYNNNMKNWTVGAYWGGNRNSSGSILNLKTLGKLEAKLKQSYNGTVKVFHDNCPRNVQVQQVNTRTTEEMESECDENL
uniref:endonuclease domain-containing 1 protein-like n=1 Tax=Oncorhynchus gorbuscha TaxID=8017 RepID=UPI001EAF78DE|nr:endonuclease domain-containing 1 protein-like [Oncorhynchus gorbuscha]